ncbi:MAG: winged helix-turn-helix transcriptional regulator [Eubacterium sp.]|nr:winged helix-turn-helix transcriptional regulator [Eubacterium sp.]
MNKKYIVQARLFKAMSDENRLKILDLLKEKPYNASELLEEMDFGQSTLSHHMKILMNAEVVTSRKNGKWIIYSLVEDAFEDMINWMKQYLSE